MTVTRLTVVGSGDAFNGAGRRHACYLLETADAGPVMVDFGPTALLGLHQLGRRANELSALLFTHLHGDHIGGYPFLFIDSMFRDQRARPLDVVGPVGTTQRLHDLLSTSYGDILGRKCPFEVRIHELLPGEQVAVAGVQVAAFAADHMDLPERPLCLRLALSNGIRLAFSGDTQMCDGLRAAANGARLLVAECSALTPPCGRHISWQVWRDMYDKMSCEQLLLSHLGADVRARSSELLAQLPAGHGVAFAEDGLVLSL